MKTIFKATFEDVDYPKSCSEEDYFDSFDKAEDFVLGCAKDVGIKKPQWEKAGNETYFNHQYDNDPKQENACYHGCITKVSVK